MDVPAHAATAKTKLKAKDRLALGVLGCKNRRAETGGTRLCFLCRSLSGARATPDSPSSSGASSNRGRQCAVVGAHVDDDYNDDDDDDVGRATRRGSLSPPLYRHTHTHTGWGGNHSSSLRNTQDKRASACHSRWDKCLEEPHTAALSGLLFFNFFFGRDFFFFFGWDTRRSGFLRLFTFFSRLVVGLRPFSFFFFIFSGYRCLGFWISASGFGGAGLGIRWGWGGAPPGRTPQPCCAFSMDSAFVLFFFFLAFLRGQLFRHNFMNTLNGVLKNYLIMYDQIKNK